MRVARSKFVEWIEQKPELYEEFVEEFYEDEFNEWVWNKFEGEMVDREI